MVNSPKVSQSFCCGLPNFTNLAAFTATIIFLADFRRWQKFGGSGYSAVARKSSIMRTSAALSHHLCTTMAVPGLYKRGHRSSCHPLDLPVHWIAAIFKLIRAFHDVHEKSWYISNGLKVRPIALTDKCTPTSKQLKTILRSSCYC